ncbi:helicase HerA-like domain-containing protein [Cellvibrio sp. NN19]|uniref:helicase HerA-like domain-containing protein n=1 Tax=Cellvibrio chitinivorans TaxID=3102792 RepID=UPI002B40E9D0|nr:helicase HerA-like domain-containing protein [Cellvibrio sp. NN19]
MTNQFLIGSNGTQSVHLNLRMANRHGLIAGATGTGKTVSLQVLAEGFAKAGVPVFMADIKGDLSGLAKAGKPHAKIDERVQLMKIADYQQRLFPCVFWDLYAKKGHPVRATISDFGPLLLANFFDLNETQTGVLYAAFKIADDQGMLILDLKDLQAMLNWMKDERKTLADEYGGISEASIAAIQRRLMMLEQEGADEFFGEPALDLNHLMQSTLEGTGVINILDATTLVNQPKLYGIFLLWLISELFENLPEQGDADKPKMVFFFDEAHLLFNDAPKLLIDKIEQVVRLIRSKGVGIYFVSQSPADIPDSVLGQLGNRVQHALRAFTPKDQQAVKIAAQTFRPNPAFSTEAAITELGIGEALVSVLDEKGSPTPVERVMVAPPASRIGPLTDEERIEVMSRSPYNTVYNQAIDRESAYEILKARVAQQAQNEEQQKVQELLRIEQERIFKQQQKVQEQQQKEQARAQQQASRSSAKRDSAVDAFAKSAARAIGSNLGRQIVRGILGSLLGGRR